MAIDGSAASSATPASEQRVSTFAALANPRFRLLWLAGVFTFFAVQAQQIARGQIAYELTGDNKGLGAVFLGFGIPMLFITPVGGVAADRLPKRTVMMAAQACLVASALWVGVADAFGFLEFWMLIAAAAVQGVGFSIYGPARVAFTGELIERSMMGNAVALTQMSLNSTRIFAPAMAGALIGIEAVGASGVFLLTAGMMMASLLITLRLPRTRVRATSGTSVIEEMLDGVRYVRRERTLLLLILFSTACVMIGFPYLAFLPAVAQDLFDAGTSGYGLMASLSAVAALATNLWIAGRVSPQRAWWLQTFSGGLFGVGLVLLGFAPGFGAGLVAIFLVGGAAAAFQSMNNTLVLTISDLEYHGRVQSLLMLGFSGFGMAALPLGIAADSAGLRPTLVGMGTTCMVATGLYVLARRRHLRSLPPSLDV